MSKILVTGANGLLATNIILELISKDYKVKGLLRDINKFQCPGHPNLELISGNIGDKESISKAVRGCSCIIHVAAVTDQSLLHYSDYRKVNVASTELLIITAIRENIKTFVYVSSANTFGYGRHNNIDNENLEIKKPFTGSYYAKSKLEAQQIALSYKDRINMIIVNPTFMLGAYDSKPGSGKIIMMGYKKKLIFYPPGGKNFIHVRDAAGGVVKAMETGKSGEAYILANENLSYKEFFQKLSKATSNKPVYIKVPKPVLLFTGLIGSALRFLGIRTNAYLTNMRIICINNFYNNRKAEKELNLTLQPVENALEDAIKWFTDKKMIR